jgi:hypothetical protein
MWVDFEKELLEKSFWIKAFGKKLLEKSFWKREIWEK